MIGNAEARCGKRIASMMSVGDHVRLAFASMRRHTLRTALTTLGIMIGVAAIVALVSFGQGARAQIEAEIARLGSDMVMVIPSARKTQGLSSGAGGQHTLTEADAAAIEREVYGVRVAVPGVTGKARVVHGNRNWHTELAGTLPKYLTARDWAVRLGRNFSDAEVATSAKVAVIGQTVAERLSPEHAILGAVIRVGSVPFRVIGILEPKGFSTVGGDQDDVMIVPLSTAKSRLVGGYRQVNRAAVAFVLIKGRGDASLPHIREAVERVLSSRHRIRAGRERDFVVHDPTAALSARKEASWTLTVMLAGVAAVSLVVGGISVMNIMLVSVMERTREIGIRVAAGAQKEDIRRQFLAEAAGVTVAGGCAGAAMGVVAAYMLGAMTGWHVDIDVVPLTGAVLFSGAIGIGAGLYPAIRASNLNPVDALRRE